MVLAWYMDNDTEVDQREPHKTEPMEEVSVKELKRLGVDYWWFSPIPDYEHNLEFQQVKKERGYSYQDLITVSPKLLDDYENKLKSFYEEHIHLDEEIRYVLEGSGYFDVRDEKDRWIRIQVELGDMIVLPAGIYHRFTLDSNNYIKALRLFVGEPVWTPYSRNDAGDNHPSVINYRQKFTAVRAS